MAAAAKARASANAGLLQGAGAAAKARAAAKAGDAAKERTLAKASGGKRDLAFFADVPTFSASKRTRSQKPTFAEYLASVEDGQAKTSGGKAVAGAEEIRDEVDGRAETVGDTVAADAKKSGDKVVGKAKKHGDEAVGRAEKSGGTGDGRAQKSGDKVAGGAKTSGGTSDGQAQKSGDKVAGGAKSGDEVAGGAKKSGGTVDGGAKKSGDQVVGRAKKTGGTADGGAQNSGAKVAGKDKCTGADQRGEAKNAESEDPDGRVDSITDTAEFEDDHLESDLENCMEEMEINEHDDGTIPEWMERDDGTIPEWMERFFAPGSNHIDMHNLVSNMAEHFLSALRTAGCSKGNPRTLPVDQTLVSLCAGSGTGELAFEGAVREIDNQYLLGLEPRTLMICEKEHWKQQYILDNIIRGDPTVCLFSDVTKLDDPDTRCLCHQRKCLLKKCRFLKSGFSCKTNSKMHSNWAQNKTAMRTGAMTESSVLTFYGTCQAILSTQPEIVCLENVDSAGPETKDDSNLKITLDLLRSLELVEGSGPSYSARVYNMESWNYGLPQSRSRIYIICIRIDSPELATDPEEFFNAVETSLEIMKLPAPFPLKALLLDETDEYLQAELSRRLQAKADQEQKVEANAQHPVSEKWVGLHMDICQERGINWPVEFDQELLDNKWFQSLTTREKEIVAFGKADNLTWIDCSQQANRARDSHDPRCSPTVLPKSLLWNYELGRLVSGRDAMSLQGYPWPVLPMVAKFTDRNLHDLAGNAFTMSCSLAVDLAVLTNIVYSRRSSSDVEEDSELKGLMDAMIPESPQSVGSSSSD
eukprot:TRINITY_DN13053_c0_g1_i1.p1 TRINITY_DN13053_c0_g1~~TRINITY_DN13053_c0_g1_i1.p1  ORF type:complete len:870 (+),score=205.06 TRINITY_DN13053_c0_g1_i1:176-2611(+)